MDNVNNELWKDIHATNSPSTEVLNGVLEGDSLGDGDTVLRDLGSTEALACGRVSDCNIVKANDTHR